MNTFDAIFNKAYSQYGLPAPFGGINYGGQFSFNPYLTAQTSNTGTVPRRYQQGSPELDLLRSEQMRQANMTGVAPNLSPYYSYDTGPAYTPSAAPAAPPAQVANPFINNGLMGTPAAPPSIAALGNTPGDRMRAGMLAAFGNGRLFG